MDLRQDYGDGSSRVPLLCEQCVFGSVSKAGALLIEQWHTENPPSAMNLGHTRPKHPKRQRGVRVGSRSTSFGSVQVGGVAEEGIGGFGEGFG